MFCNGIHCFCCLQVWHWRQIFHQVGQEYDSLKQYKVGELVNLHLTVYTQLIDSILSSAIEAYGVERRFNKIRSFWMEREFKLAKHLLESTQKPGQNKMLCWTNNSLFLGYYSHFVLFSTSIVLKIDALDQWCLR